MKVGVTSLTDHPIELQAHERPGDLGLAAEGVDFHAAVEISVKLTRMQEDILAQGEARTTARTQCSRCLDDVELALVGRFEALFVPQAGAYGQRLGTRHFEWGDQRVSFYTEGTIDLSSEIAQCLRIELPMKPLCRPDCAGLCPTCGKNLNDGPCTCEPQDTDDTWAPLRDLFPPADREP